MAVVKELHVNGAARAVEADPARSLLSVLRDDLGLTGAKYGCGEAHCGACTVLLDGKAVRSCSTRVDAASGKKVGTIEGLAAGLHQVFLILALVAASGVIIALFLPARIPLNTPAPGRTPVPAPAQAADGGEQD